MEDARNDEKRQFYDDKTKTLMIHDNSRYLTKERLESLRDFIERMQHTFKQSIRKVYLNENFENRNEMHNITFRFNLERLRKDGE